MDGLIVSQPYANLIIGKKKTWELRTRKPPTEKINSEIFLLSEENMLGEIKIKNTKGPLGLKELKENYNLHQSSVEDIDDGFSCYAWEIDVCEIFDEPKKYFHPNGARIWVKNVIPMENHLLGKLTSYM